MRPDGESAVRKVREQAKSETWREWVYSHAHVRKEKR